MAGKVTKNRRDGTLTIVDGSVTPVQTLIEFAEGDFTYNEPAMKEPIVIKNRKGELKFLKVDDKFSGFGRVSFSFQYQNKTIRGLLSDPATTSAVAADKIHSNYKTVNLVFVLNNESGAPEETHTLYNCRFARGNVKFKEGNEYNTISAEGIIMGKIDAGVRKFVAVT